jgi:uncharacterized membrane protein HdeD (DUF308 family)
MGNFFQRNLKRLNGVLAIIFGLVALFFPGITLAALGVYFAISILAGGVMQIISSFKLRSSNRHWYLLLVEGLIGILIAVIILSRPKLLATVFVTIIGLWALFLGLIFLFTYFKRQLPVFYNSFFLIVSILSLIMGLTIVVNPFESTRVVTVMIGIYTLAYGIFSMVNSSRNYE